jgi:hypothetical protein
MDEVMELRLKVYALENVLQFLWATIISNTGARDLGAEHRRVSEASLQSLEGLFSQEIDPEAIHVLLHHEERFWSSVGERVRNIERGLRR